MTRYEELRLQIEATRLTLLASKVTYDIDNPAIAEKCWNLADAVNGEVGAAIAESKAKREDEEDRRRRLDAEDDLDRELEQDFELDDPEGKAP